MTGTGAAGRKNAVDIVPLSKDPQYPCLFLDFQQMPFLLDCALEILRPWAATEDETKPRMDVPPSPTHSSSRTPLKFVVPRLAALAQSIETVLISNPYNMLALPYLTEYLRFTGNIYATGPTVEFGRLLMEELVHIFQRNSESGRVENNVHFQNELHPLYSLHDIEMCIAKIRRVHYSEIVELDDHGDDITITALSSGFCLGAANWIIESPNGKVSYVAASSNSELGHSTIMDTRPFEDMDAMILTQLGTAMARPLVSTVSQMLQLVVRTLEQRGNILFPVHPNGAIFDLISFVSDALEKSGFTETPIHVVSPVAQRALHLANIEGEWMSKDKQANLYEALKPLKHGKLMETRMLHHHEYGDPVLNFKPPYIVFAGHPSLFGGDAASFVDIWRDDPKNLLVITEPLAPPLKKLPTESEMQLQTCTCVMETRLSLEEVMTRNSARNVVVPLRASASPRALLESLPNRGRSMLRPLEPMQDLSIPFTRNFVRAYVTDESLKNAGTAQEAPLITGKISTANKRVCTVQCTIPINNPLNGLVAAAALAKSCLSELGPARILDVAGGVTIDWSEGYQRVVFALQEVRVEATDMRVMAFLKSAVSQVVK